MTVPAGLRLRPVAFDANPRSCWDRLLARIWSPTPFSRWTFDRAWWDAYGDTAHEQYFVCLPAAALAARRSGIRCRQRGCA